MIEVKIPGVIKIGGFDYRIRFEPVETECDCGETWGWWKNEPCEITINPKADKARCSSTFIHEILHAIDDTFLGQKLEEQDVHNLAAGLHQVFSQMGVEFIRDDLNRY